MATKHIYLAFYIHLTDTAQVAALQATDFTSGAWLRGLTPTSPDAAAVTYSAPKKTTMGTGANPFAAPCITSDWFVGSGNFPTDVATFTRKSGGWFGWHWLFGDTFEYHWQGWFIYAAPGLPPGVAVPINISPRRWIDGFELPVLGEGGTGNLLGECVSRDASRRGDGYGLALRSVATGTVRTHIPTENIGGALPQSSWERLYVRLRGLPSATAMFWRAHTTVQAAAGLALAITPTGQIAAFVLDAAANMTLLGSTAALALNVWTRLDMVIWFGNAGMMAPVPSNLKLWVNGTVVLDITLLTNGIATVGRLHAQSDVGNPTANDLGLDVDDWMCADAPGAVDGVDFQNGSAIIPITATAFDPSTTGWTGDWRTVLQNPVAGAGMTLSAPGASVARLELKTDAAQTIDGLPEGLGIVALLVGFFGAEVKAGSSIVASSAAIAPTPLVITGGVGRWYSAFWRVTGAVTQAIKPIAPLTLLHLKTSAGGAASTVTAFAAVAEVLGTFGPEDAPHLAPVPVPLPVHLGPHNAPYPRTPWARLTVPPQQPVFIRAGTYVGNGTGQDLTFPVPIHFLWIRPVTGDAGGTKWWSTLLAAHKSHGVQPVPNLMVQAVIDPDFVPGTAADIPSADPPYPLTVQEAITQANELAYWPNAKHLNNGYWDALYLADPAYAWSRMLGLGAGGADIALYGRYATVPSAWHGVTQQEQTLLRLTGTDTQNNAGGVTYSYLAVGDPGMRFLLNAALNFPRDAVDRPTTLIHPRFTPLAGFFWPDNPADPATSLLAYKGPGHAAASYSPLTLAQVANVLTFGLATVTSKAAYHAIVGAVPQVAMSLWRVDDTSGHAGAVVQILSYVGDGVSPRTIALTPASTKSPLWALVVPHNAAGVQRDPSHTGTTSTTLPSTANAAQGIRGGDIDAISVGTDLNTAGIVYDVFVIPGAANAGGWSPPGDFMPVPPDPPDDAPTPPVPDVPGIDPFPEPPTGTPIDPLAPTGPLPGLPDDLAPECKPDTIRAVNLALSRLGVTKQVVDLALEVTLEAVVAREVYRDAVEAVLRDFPWPFATRYVRLALVSDPTLAVNSDWLYSYRQPTDCLFERRLVVARQGAVDPAPVPFQLSSDTTGGLLFTNQPNAVLEYTARPACPFTRSEPLFRDAMAWQLATAMGPGLSRMTAIVEHCAKQYQATLEQARQVLRPGNAGETTPTATVDVAPLLQAANVLVVNHALIRIGAPTIRNLATDQSRAAQAAKLIFEQVLREVLRDFPWPFATTYAALTLVAGTATVPVNADWTYSYRLPTDLVFARRLGGTLKRAYDRNPPPFRLAQDATGGLLLTDVEATTTVPLVLEYTARLEGTVYVADVLFRDAFAWKLAASLAPSLARVLPEAAEQVGRGPEDLKAPRERSATLESLRARATQYAEAKYQQALQQARVAAANESQVDTAPPDADWITGRN